jgi:hypothetical protein
LFLTLSRLKSLKFSETPFVLCASKQRGEQKEVDDGDEEVLYGPVRA